LFWAALVLWCLQERNWIIPAGFGVGLAAALVGPLLLDPSVLAHYRQLTAEHPPTQYASPTVGTILRYLVGEEHFWLQFVAPVVGLVWLFVYWWRSRQHWDWHERLPLILLVSLVTMAYGWLYDLALALAAVVQAASRPTPRWLLVAYAAMGIVALGQVAATMSGFSFFWFAPTLLALYLIHDQGWQGLSPRSPG